MSLLPFRSFAHILEGCKENYGGNVLFRTFDRQWSYSDFCSDVVRFAGWLSQHKQEYLYIASQHPYRFCVACFAAFTVSKTALLLDEPEQAENILRADDTTISQCLSQPQPMPVMKQDADDTPCVIIKSSGTTSVSKGVVLSHKNLITELDMLIRYKPFPEREVYYHLLPYSHLFGLLGEFLIPLCTAGTVCFADNDLTLFRNFAHFKPTYLCIPPAVSESIARILETTDDFVCATGGELKTIISGGAFLREQTRDTLEVYGINVYTAYGLTECSPVISIERDGKSLRKSVGQVLPCCNVKTVQGEILVSGDTVMLGYWNDPVSTAAVIEDGWLHTGDMGYVDKNGYLFLTGRKTNLIVFENGEKLMAEQLEKELCGICGVKEALVIGKSIEHKRSRTVIDVFVYAQQDAQPDGLKEKIRSTVSRFADVGLLGSITFLTQPLRRNALGKIDRAFYKQKTIPTADV